jgi:hypothetical protein
MVSLDEMRQHDPTADLIAGAGHNAHVQRPDKVWEVFELLASSGKPNA